MSFGPPLFSTLYALGDSYSGPLESLGLPSGLLAGAGYGDFLTDAQGDLDGDGVDDGTTFVETAAGPFMLASEIQNFAIPGAPAVGSETVAAFLASLGGGSPVLEDLAEVFLPPELLATDIGLTAQTERVIAAFESDPDPNAAATIQINGNDFGPFFDELAPQLENPTFLDILGVILAFNGLVADIADSIVQSGEALAEAGFRTVVYATNTTDQLPAVRDAFGPFSFIASLAAASQDRLAIAGLEALEASHDVDVRVVDHAAFFDAVADDPASFGLLSVEEPFNASAGPVVTVDGTDAEVSALPNEDRPKLADGSSIGKDQVVFFDAIHYSANFHDALGAFYQDSLRETVRFLSDQPDRAFGDAGENVVFAGGGNDTVDGFAAADVLFGGQGNDRLRGGDDGDILVGGSGDDTAIGDKDEAASDVLIGNDGDDFLSGRGAADALFGGLGNDEMRGGGGRDLIFKVEEVLLGGPVASNDKEIIRGGGGNDTLVLLLADDGLMGDIADAVTGNTFSIDALGISAHSIERVVAYVGRGLPDLEELGVGEPLREALVEADLRGVGLPALEEPPVAVFDSDGLLMV